MRSNFSIDADAQLRMLPAVAPVGRRSLLRYSGGSHSALLRGVRGLRTPRPSRAGQSVLACRQRPVVMPGAVAAFISVRVHGHSLAPSPGRARVHSSAVAGAARFPLSARSCESASRRSRPSQAQSDVGCCGPRQCECRALGVRQAPRHNEPVDSDAQLRTLPAVAPVGRRSPLR